MRSVITFLTLLMSNVLLLAAPATVTFSTAPTAAGPNGEFDYLDKFGTSTGLENKGGSQAVDANQLASRVSFQAEGTRL